MDLCLQGSQINLVPRQPQKTVVNQPARSRPQSATYSTKRTRASPLTCRPQSADSKIRRRRTDSRCGQNGFGAGVGGEYQSAKLSKLEKRYASVSSSDLLQILLDEPIRRPWLCRGSPAEGASSSDEAHAEFQDSQRPSTNSNSNKNGKENAAIDRSRRLKDSEERRRGLAECCQVSSIPGRIHNNFAASKMSRVNSADAKKDAPGSAARSSPSDYWNSSTYASLCNIKADLPGRVSFSNANAATNDVEDYSDCDNDRQQEDRHPISAPGPMTLSELAPSTSANGDFTTTSPADVASTGQKKSVHFGAAGKPEVFAQTYEYPKCPSDNCSCSSTTTSINDATDACKYSLDPEKKCRLSLDLKTLADKNESQSSVDEILEEEEEEDGCSIMRKNTQKIEDRLTKGDGVKKPFESPNSKLIQLNNVELAMGHHSSDDNTTAPKSPLEKPNNFSDFLNTKTKNQTHCKSSSKQNLAKDLLKADKQLNFDGSDQKAKESSSFNSEDFLNNYLEMIATKSIATIFKKQQNKSSPEEDSTKLKTKFTAVKIATRSSEREESNLKEFSLDKVDSWMSMHNREEHPPKSSADQLTKKWNGNEDDVASDAESEVSTESNQSSHDDTTYDEIVSVIKEIEEDKKSDNFAQSRGKKVELTLDGEKQRDVRPEKTIDRDSEKRSSSPDKYKDIINYLDDVEDSCDKTLLETRRSIPESNRSEIEFVVEPDIAEDVPKLSDLLMVPNHQLARRVISLSLRANELANALLLSKEHVLKIRSEKQKTIRNEKANAVSRMRDQKKHYETIVTRHQGFIEQLLKDKGSLCEKLAALTRRLESQNQAWEHKLAAEVQRVKETTMAGEKIRRERWVRENTKKIKELTVKGLEAEINRMTYEHQREVNELKRAHQQQMLDAMEEARLKYEQMESTIRESCAEDREAIIEKERVAVRERFDRQLSEEKRLFDEQKLKLSQEVNAERERVQAELKEKEAEYQNKRSELQREKEQEIEEALAEMQEKMAKQEEKYQNRFSTIEKQYLADFELWKRDYENTLKVQQIEKENAIRQHYREERDRQIDAIVVRMDAESVKCSEEFDVKMSRVKEKYEKDLQAAEAVEKSLSDKYTDARNRLAESDAQVRNFQAEIKQLQLELGHSKKMCSEFLAEREKLRENLRKDVQNEVATLKTEHDNEIQKIHKRVQQAIEKKDATVELLQKENGSLRERCIKLEAVIRQQRKDYCVK